MSATDTHIKRTTPRKKRSMWRWALWIFLGLTILLLIIAAFLWGNRYQLLEKTAEDILLEQGIKAELSIESIGKTQAILTDIRFLENEGDSQTPFFSAQKIVADYEWREALKGHVRKLVLTKPQARVTLDATGKIIDGWLPPKGEAEDGSVSMPPDGIFVEDGDFTIASPFGDATVQIDARYFSPENLTAQLDIAPTQFSYQDWQLSGGGSLDVELKGEAPKLDLDLKLSSLEHPIIDATDLHVKGNMIPFISDAAVKIEGTLDFDYGSLVTAQIMSGAGMFKWDGIVEHDRDRAHPLAMTGTWSSKADDIALPDPARRADLTKKLSLSDALLKAPIAQNFSGDLTRTIMSLLKKSDIEASGGVELNAQGLAVNLTGPAVMSGTKTRLTLAQTDWAPLYNFSRFDEKMRLAFHAGLTAPASLTFREAELVAVSKNGWQLEGVEKFSANIATAQTWRSKRLEGDPARLAPFSAQVLYKGGDDPRDILLAGGIDYDGPVPGGYVTGLKTAGRMNMALNGTTRSVTFKPSNDTPIVMRKFETTTNWRAEDIAVTLLSDTPIYRLKGNSASMAAELAKVSLIAIDETDTKNLGMTFAQMTVAGELTGEKQSWDILGKTAKICSEDMPGPGTEITTPEARIQVQRESADTPMQFFMAAPEADVKTQLVNATGIRVEAAGMPDKYVLRYNPGEAEQGRVKFAGDAIPRLPMTGMVNFEDGAFKGTAKTTLPLTDDTPIDISYYFKDGKGTADVNIPELRFLPKGLQPQYLVSALKGKIAEVEGLVQANIKLAFAAGQPLQSSGTAKIIDMNFGTLPGPFSGVNAEMKFSNMFPLQSQGRQTLTVDKLDPGFPLENGTIEFEMIPDGVKVYSARWPLGEGFFSLDPFEWLYSNSVNRVVMRIENVSIGEFLKDLGDGAIKATGNLEGTFPIVMSGVDVKVENGELLVKDGGRIQYQSKQLNSISELDGTDERAVKAIRAGNYRDAAFEALKDFRYDELRVRIDGPLDGEIGVDLKFDGKNEDVLGGQPFRFDISLEGELLNIIRSFNTNAQIKSELARRGLSKEDETPDLEQ